MAIDRRKSAAKRFEEDRKKKAAAAAAKKAEQEKKAAAAAKKAEAKKQTAKKAEQPKKQNKPTRSLGLNPTTSVRDTFRQQAALPKFGTKQTAEQRMQWRSENWARLEGQKSGADKSTRKKIEAAQDKLHKANQKDAQKIGAAFHRSGTWRKDGETLFQPNVLPGMNRDAQRAGTEQSLRSGVVAPDMQKAAKKHQDAVWDRVHGPETGERVKKTLSGAVKGFASDIQDFHGLSVTGRGMGMEKEHAREIKVWEDEIRQWEKSLHDWEADGSLTKEERKELTDLIAANRKKIEMYEKLDRGTRTASEQVYQSTDKLDESSGRDIAEAKRGLSPGANVMVDVGAAGTQMAMDMIGGPATLFIRSMGGAAKEARHAGASHMDQVNYGTMSAATSVLTEQISNLAGPLKKAFGKGVADDLIQKGIDKAVKKLAGSASGEKILSTIAKHGINALGEGFEESLEAAIDPQLKRMTYDPNAEWDIGEIIYSGIVGAGTGLLAGSGMEAAQNALGTAARGVRDHAVSHTAGKTPLPLPYGKPKTQESQAIGTEMQEPPAKPEGLTIAYGKPKDALIRPAERDTFPLEGEGSGVETAIDTNPETHTPEPVKAGRATTIFHPYAGKVPKNGKTSGSDIQIPKEAVSAAQQTIDEAAKTGHFKKSVKTVLQNLFSMAGGQRKVTLDNVTFDGKSYEVSLNPNIAGKVASDPHMTPEKLAVFSSLDDIVKTSEYVGSGQYSKNKGKAANVFRYDYFERPIIIGDTPYVVAFDVEVYRDSNNLRTYRVINEIDLTPIAATHRSSTGGLTTAVSDLFNNSIPQTGGESKPQLTIPYGKPQSSEAAPNTDKPGLTIEYGKPKAAIPDPGILKQGDGWQAGEVKPRLGREHEVRPENTQKINLDENPDMQQAFEAAQGRAQTDGGHLRGFARCG